MEMLEIFYFYFCFVISVDSVVLIDRDFIRKLSPQHFLFFLSCALVQLLSSSFFIAVIL